MRKIILLALVSILFVASSSCATTKQATPDWVVGRFDAELSAKYILAVGSGRSREGAEKDARHNLASYFGTDINSRTYAGTTYYERGGSVQTSQVYNTDLLVDVKVDDLVCVEEIESFVDRDGAFYVLLGMNKRDSVAYYSSKLTDLNKEISFEYAGLEYSPHNLENLISLASLRKKVSKATEIIGMIGLIDGSRHYSASVSSFLVEELRKEYIDDISFSIELNGDAVSFVSSIESVITGNGFHLSSDPTASVVMVNLSLSNITGNTRNCFCGFDLAIEIKDKESGKIVYSWRKQGREAMSTYEQAQAKVIYNLSKNIEKEFNDDFANSF